MKMRHPYLPEDDWQVVKATLEALGETEQQSRVLMIRVARTCGIDFVRETLQKAEETEAQGGLMTLNGDRRRTPGGVFFHLARNTMTDEQCSQIFPRRTTRETANMLQWDERFQLIETIERRGEIHDMQVKLIGFPGRYEQQGNTIVLQMTYDAGVNSQPIGVPSLPELTTVYTVYIAAKQWFNIRKDLTPQHWLVVEGLLSPDPETDTLAVFAHQVSTKKAKELSEVSKPRKQMHDKNVAEGQEDDTTSRNRSQTAPSPAPLEPIAVIIPDNAPPDVQAKLQQLYAAAQQYHAKVTEIQSKPEDQRFGLAITQKLLAGVQGQITAIVGEYSD